MIKLRDEMQDWIYNVYNVVEMSWTSFFHTPGQPFGKSACALVSSLDFFVEMSPIPYVGILQHIELISID